MIDNFNLISASPIIPIKPLKNKKMILQIKKYYKKIVIANFYEVKTK